MGGRSRGLFIFVHSLGTRRRQALADFGDYFSLYFPAFYLFCLVVAADGKVTVYFDNYDVF